MNNYDALSYCGIYCGKCSNYKQNMNCLGCREELNLLVDCPTRACAEKRKLLHCGECESFPCEMLEKWYNDGNPLHLQAYYNILEINKIGVDNWLKKQLT